MGGKKVRALSLEILKRRVDRGLYKRLDTLQRDVFWVLARARRLSRTDSQAGGRDGVDYLSIPAFILVFLILFCVPDPLVFFTDPDMDKAREAL